MKPIIWIRLFLCCAAIGTFRPIEAQNIHSVLQEGEVLRFDRTVLNVGTLTEDDTIQTYRFVCTNVSGEAVKLTQVRTTCGCTAADFHTGEILPGETRVIALNYTPKNHPGTNRHECFHLSVFFRQHACGMPHIERECASRSG